MSTPLKPGGKIAITVATAALLIVLLALAQVPTPHGIAGWIFDGDGATQVPLGTKFRVNDSTSGDVIVDTTKVPVPGFSGRYSVAIQGNNGDAIIIHAWNDSQYGEQLVTLQGDMDGVNVSINTTRPPESNVTIEFPADDTSFNMTFITAINATIKYLGGSGTQCNATLSISNQTVWSITQGSSEVIELGNADPGNSFTVSFNISAAYTGTANLTIASRCLESTLLFDGNGQATAYNITVQDKIPPNITLYTPLNNTVTINNTILFRFSVNDTWVGTANCSLVIDSTIVQTNTSINEFVNQTINHTLTFGSYGWQILCYDFEGNARFSGTRNLNITDPDPMINSSNIVIPDTATQENRNITINATIVNLGNEDVASVIIQFWDIDDFGNDVQLGTNKTISIDSGEQVLVQMNYTTLPGIHYITVRVDPPLETNGSITETNETNNQANITIGIPIWQVTYGNVISDLLLGLDTSSELYSWFNTSFLSGNLYVIDDDSSVEWSSLLALGNNLSNETQMDDFDELDIKLNYSGFDDSVNSTYTFAGSVKNLTNLTVYDLTIYNVPIHNSTNNSQFYTGILWDTSDGGAEYDGTQDVVFVANIRGTLTQGSYGIYNYEIRIPGNLDRYVQPSSSNDVNYYVELS